MSISCTFSIGKDGKLNFEYGSKFRADRSKKGKSLVSCLDEYTVIDLETTGLDSYWDDIIEIGALKIKNGIVIDSYSSLVKPDEEISDFISKLTGITNEMLLDAPNMESVMPDFLDFIGDSILLGHNVHFDINFLYDKSMSIFNEPFSNSFVDTMRISRKLFPDFNNHKLNTLIRNFSLEKRGFHRALDDCHYTYQIYEKIKNHISENELDLNKLFNTYHKSCKAADICAKTDVFDESHPLYGKVCVFTGTLEKMVRKDAMQVVANLGGICGDSVTKITNFLILGNNDYCSTIKDGKSSKQKKAEKLILEGQDLQIISENVFYDML